MLLHWEHQDSWPVNFQEPTHLHLPWLVLCWDYRYKLLTSVDVIWAVGSETQDFLLLQALYPPNNLLNLDVLISLHCLKKKITVSFYKASMCFGLSESGLHSLLEYLVPDW